MSKHAILAEAPSAALTGIGCRQLSLFAEREGALRHNEDLTSSSFIRSTPGLALKGLRNGYPKNNLPMATKQISLPVFLPGAPETSLPFEPTYPLVKDLLSHGLHFSRMPQTFPFLLNLLGWE